MGGGGAQCCCADWCKKVRLADGEYLNLICAAPMGSFSGSHQDDPTEPQEVS